MYFKRENVSPSFSSSESTFFDNVGAYHFLKSPGLKCDFQIVL